MCLFIFSMFFLNLDMFEARELMSAEERTWPADGSLKKTCRQ